MPLFVAALVAARHNRAHNHVSVDHAAPLWLLLADEATHALTHAARRVTALLAPTRRAHGGDTS